MEIEYAFPTITNCRELPEAWKFSVSTEGGITGTRVFLKSLECTEGPWNETLPWIGSTFYYPIHWFNPEKNSATFLPLYSSDDAFKYCLLRSIDTEVVSGEPNLIKYTCNYSTKETEMSVNPTEEEEWSRNVNISVVMEEFDLGTYCGLSWRTSPYNKLVTWSNTLVEANGTSKKNAPVWDITSTNGVDSKAKLIFPSLQGTVTVTKVYKNFNYTLEKIVKTSMCCNELAIFNMPPETVLYEGGNMEMFHNPNGNKRWRCTHNFTIKYHWCGARGLRSEILNPVSSGVAGWNHFLRPDGYWDTYAIMDVPVTSTPTWTTSKVFPIKDLKSELSLGIAGGSNQPGHQP